MVSLALAVGLPVGALIVVAAVYFASLKSRYHYTSVLTCPKCQKTFDHDWVPAMSFSALRLGRSRYMQCPLCHEWSTFNIWDTRKPASA